MASSYLKRTRLKIITIMPTIKLTMGRWVYPYDLDTGISSSIDIKTISPAIPDNRYPSIAAFKKGSKIKAVRIAPIGSTTPDRKDHKNALPLLPVAL